MLHSQEPLSVGVCVFLCEEKIVSAGLYAKQWRVVVIFKDSVVAAQHALYFVVVEKTKGGAATEGAARFIWGW